MRKTAILSLVAVLAACGEPEETTATPEAEAEAEVVAEGMQIQPGLYAVGDETTEYARTRLSADGTYVDLAEGEEVGSGTWTTDGAVMCFDPEGEGEDMEERCWINGPPNADGSFTSTRDDGSQSYLVTPISE